MANEKLYLAGPEVFLLNMKEIRLAKLEICALYNFTGIFPVDDEALPATHRKNIGHYICRQNKEKISTAHGLIANITPFRSVSADVGTVYEIGYADGLQKPVFAYTNNPIYFAHRCINEFDGRALDENIVDRDNIIIEDFDMMDNLMLDGAILDSSNTLIVTPYKRDLDDLTLFEHTIKRARKFFNGETLKEIDFFEL